MRAGFLFRALFAGVKTLRMCPENGVAGFFVKGSESACACALIAESAGDVLRHCGYKSR